MSVVSEDMKASPSPSSRTPAKWAMPPSDFAASWLSYGTAVLFTQPLDTLRIRYQTRDQRFLNTWRIDGVRSLYAGVATPLCGNGPIVAFIFTCNEALKYLLRRVRGKDELGLVDTSVAGGLSGLAVTLIQCPVTTVRIQQQLSARGGAPALSFVTVVRQLVAVEGVRGLYRGVWGEAFSNGCGRLLYFTVYDAVKRWLAVHPHPYYHNHHNCVTARLTTNTQGASDSEPHLLRNDKNAAAVAERRHASVPTPPTATEFQLKERIVAAILASWIGWFFIFPVDSVKNRYQGDAIVQVQAHPLKGVTTATMNASTCTASPAFTSFKGSEKRDSQSVSEALKKNGGDLLQSVRPEDVACTNTCSSVSGRGRGTLRMETKRYNSLIHCWRETAKSESIRGFYKGFGITIFRAAFVSGISLPLFDFLQPKFRGLVSTSA